ncbi:MAG: isochorismate synthase, partial [Actinomycetota bacterium]|nr:isochorismate synthase [Actinomycetota bacterium]
MTTVRGASSPSAFALDDGDRKRLRKRLEQAVKRARRGAGRSSARTADEMLASVTVAVGHDVDPSAVVLASRRPGDPWFCTEQPDRDRAAVAALGCVVAIEARGRDRFEQVAARWR